MEKIGYCFGSMIEKLILRSPLRFIQKSWELQKAHLGLLHNIRTKFQLPSSIWRGVMRGINSRNDGNEKTRPKNHFFWTVRG